MSATGAGYDQSVSTFSPNGRVFQVEYAYKAVEKSGTIMGIVCVDGVVLGVEKQVTHKMLVPHSNKRIAAVDYHVALAQCGLAADARQLLNKGRSESQDYQSFYGTPITGKVLSERLGGHIHNHTLYWYLRPFGCAILLAVYDEVTDGGPSLYSLEPSGQVSKLFAGAIGRHKQGAVGELEKLDFTKITVREAVDEIARIVYKFHDSIKDKELELELTWICDASERKVQIVPTDIAEAAIALAKDKKQKEEMEESDDEDEEKGGTAASTVSSTSGPATVTATTVEEPPAPVV